MASHALLVQKVCQLVDALPLANMTRPDLAIHIHGLSLAVERSTGVSPASGSVSTSVMLRGNVGMG